MVVSKASKGGMSRFVNGMRLKQNSELLDKPVSFCNKVIDTYISPPMSLIATLASDHIAVCLFQWTIATVATVYSIEPLSLPLFIPMNHCHCCQCCHCLFQRTMATVSFWGWRRRWQWSLWKAWAGWRRAEREWNCYGGLLSCSK